MNQSILFKTPVRVILLLTCSIIYNDLSAQTDDSSEMAETERQYHHLILSRAMNLQLTADSMNRAAGLKHAELRNTLPPEEKNKLMGEISLLEKKSELIQKEADELFRMLRGSNPHMRTGNEPDSSSPVELKEVINGIKVYQYKTGSLQVATVVATAKPDHTPADSLKSIKIRIRDNDRIDIDTVIYDDFNPIPGRIPVPGKLVYYIQLGVFTKKVPDDTFGAVSPVCYDYFKDKGVFKYYAGLFFSFESADKALLNLKAAGYTGSFIVAFNNNEQVSTEKARQIEYSQIKF